MTTARQESLEEELRRTRHALEGIIKYMRGVPEVLTMSAPRSPGNEYIRGVIDTCAENLERQFGHVERRIADYLRLGR